MTFGLQFREDLASKLEVRLLKSLSRALNVGFNPRRIKELDGLIAQRLLQRVGELAGTGKTVPGLLSHRLVGDSADRLVHGRIEV